MQFMHTLFVNDEELMRGIQGYSLCLLDNYSGVNIHMHLLHKIFSRNFSSIQSGPILFQLRQIVHVWTMVA